MTTRTLRRYELPALIVGGLAVAASAFALIQLRFMFSDATIRVDLMPTLLLSFGLTVAALVLALLTPAGRVRRIGVALVVASVALMLWMWAPALGILIPGR